MAKEIIQRKLKLKLIVEYYFPKGYTDNLRPYLSSQPRVFFPGVTFNADCSVVIVIMSRTVIPVVNCNNSRRKSQYLS